MQLNYSETEHHQQICVQCLEISGGIVIWVKAEFLKLTHNPNVNRVDFLWAVTKSASLVSLPTKSVEIQESVVSVSLSSSFSPSESK